MGGDALLRSYNGGGSMRWRRSSRATTTDAGGGRSTEMEGLFAGGAAAKKRVMVVVDGGAGAKHAMMWALTHVATKGDIFTLLHVLHSRSRHRGGGGATCSAARKDVEAMQQARSLAALCKACKPEVKVEALVIRGPKLATVIRQVKKLEASVLVLKQSKPSLLRHFCCSLFRSKNEDFVEQCIDEAECLTFAVRKQSPGVGGYLISTKWQKNFWLLA